MRGRVCGVVQQDVLLFRSHRQARFPGRDHQPSERKWKEPRVPGASLDRVDVRAGTSGPHLFLCQTRGARGRGEYESGGHVVVVEKVDALPTVSQVTMDAR